MQLVFSFRNAAIGTALIVAGYYGYRGMDDCWDCYYWGYTNLDVRTTSNAMVFPKPIPERRLVGDEEVCYTSPDYRRNRHECWDEDGPQSCVYHTGNVVCRSLNGAQPHCTGSIYRCEQDDEGQRECHEVDADTVETQTNCHTREKYRHWVHYDLHVLDLSDPDNPVLGEPLSMPRHEEGVSVRNFGADDVYVSYVVPVDVENDSRPFVRYFFKRVDLTNPANPRVRRGVNVPGEVIAADHGGRRIFTRDVVWGSNIVETAINKLTVADGRAYLEARRRFVDQQVSTIDLDSRGNLLVSHRLAWSLVDYEERRNVTQDLTILDAQSDDMQVLGEAEVDVWAQLQEVQEGRALFSVPGGLLVINIDDAQHPFAQAYYPTRGWPRGITMAGDNVWFAAGRYGIYKFDMDAFNLHIQ